MKSLRIVFMGTPDFAVPSLQALHESPHEVVGVVTAPDKPAGRGLKVRTSAVKDYAESQELKVLQPIKLRSEAFLQELASLKADLFVVVAFRMLPEVVWSMPARGTFNLHASLLPNYRGAAPINWAVINGEKETGLSTFFLQHAIDTGHVIMQAPIAIFPDETAGDLHDRMMEKGADLVLETTNAIAKDEVKTTPQKMNGNEKPAPKIFKDDGRINWEADVRQVYNHIRGLSPYPTAWTTFGGKVLKVYQAGIIQQKTNAKPGTVDTDGSSYLHVATQNGSIVIKEMQLQGKKRMEVANFLRGARNLPDEVQ